MNKFLDGLSDDEVVELASQMKNGIHMSVPVFDGAKEEEIGELFPRPDFRRAGRLRCSTAGREYRSITK